MIYSINGIPCDSEYLAHHGILGMKWGIRRTPEQLGHKKANSDAPRHKGSLSERMEAKRKKKRVVASLEKARQAKIDRRTHEQQKAAALKSGSATEVAKFKGELTQQEMRDAINRINLETQLATLVKAETPKKKTILETADGVMSTATKIADITNKGVSVWNSIAKIMNSIEPNSMPIIGEEKKVDKFKEQKKEIAKYISDTGNLGLLLANYEKLGMTKAEVTNVINRLRADDIAKLKEAEKKVQDALEEQKQEQREQKREQREQREAQKIVIEMRKKYGEAFDRSVDRVHSRNEDATLDDIIRDLESPPSRDFNARVKELLQSPVSKEVINLFEAYD